MANVINSQPIDDGNKNTVYRFTAQLDTSNESYVVKLDPATLSRVTEWGPDAPANRASKFRVQRILFDVEDGLTVNLWWDADGTQPNASLLASLNGRGKKDYRDVGGLAIPTTFVTANGKLALSTEGWQTGSVLSYDIELWVAKQP